VFRDLIVRKRTEALQGLSYKIFQTLEFSYLIDYAILQRK